MEQFDVIVDHSTPGKFRVWWYEHDNWVTILQYMEHEGTMETCVEAMSDHTETLADIPDGEITVLECVAVGFTADQWFICVDGEQ